MSEVLNELDTHTQANGVSRRRVVAGVAWSLPVIATAIAAPAAAASGIPASVTLGAPAAITLAGAAAASGTGPTGFDIQTGSVFTGTSVSYTITIESELPNQKALVHIGSASPGSGTNTVAQNKKNTTFTGTLSTTPGNQALQVTLSGYNYTETATKGTFTYAVTLTVTMAGSPATVRTSTLTVTF